MMFSSLYNKSAQLNGFNPKISFVHFQKITLGLCSCSSIFFSFWQTNCCPHVMRSKIWQIFLQESFHLMNDWNNPSPGLYSLQKLLNLFFPLYLCRDPWSIDPEVVYTFLIDIVGKRGIFHPFPLTVDISTHTDMTPLIHQHV